MFHDGQRVRFPRGRSMERDFVRQAQTGDHDAFAELARDVLERVYGTARLILLDQGRAERAARDALVAAWREVRRLPDPDGFEPWLQGIVVRSSNGADAGRAHGVLAVVDESREAFGGLPVDDRTVLALVYFAELTVPETSIALGVPSATAEARLHGAFDALRIALDVDDTANARIDLEWRLRSWLGREATPPDLASVLAAVIAETRSTPQRRRSFQARRRLRPVSAGKARRIGIAVVSALALVVAVSGGVLLTRLVPSPVQAERRPLTGTLTPSGEISAVTGTLDEPALAVLTDGRVLVVGLGDGLIGALIYDPASAKYGDPTRDEVLRHLPTMTTLANNLVLLTGGTFAGGEAPSDTAVLFDPVSSTFATTSRLTVPRAGHTATLLDDGRVLIAGGRHSEPGSRSGSAVQGGIDSAEIYDPATGGFAPTSPMVHARAGHTATRLQDGRVLIAGGYLLTQSGDVGAPSADAEVFDPTTGTFAPAGRMITARGDHSATLLADGRVLIAGGGDGSPGYGEAPHVFSNAEVFDPKTSTFSTVGSLVTERANHTATLLPDGRVLVAGGRNDLGEPRSTEIFDPRDGAFTPGPVAASPHRATLAPLIEGGRVLLTGSGPDGSEIFDPQGAPVPAAAAAPGARAFTPVQTRVMHDRPSLVELDDGRILIVGGSIVGAADAPPAREILDPASGTPSPTGTDEVLLTDIATTRLPDGKILVVGIDGDGVGEAETFDARHATFEGANAPIIDAIRDRRAVTAVGLPAGQLLLSEGGNTIRVLDATTGALGPAVQVCDSPQSAVALDATH